VDVLPDREAATLAKWLLEHPGVEVISRDRAGAYADGARQGAPNAQQVCDRFHLLLNLQEALKRLFERKHERLKLLAQALQAEEVQVKEMQAKPSQEAPAEPSSESVHSIAAGPLLSPVHEAQRQIRRDKRKQCYDEVMKLHEQGVSQVAIATLLGLHRETVRRYLNAPAFPEIIRPPRGSKLDAFKDYLQQRLSEGEQNVTHLIAELRVRGYRGGETVIYDYLRPLRELPEWMEAYQQQKARQTQGKRSTPLSAREAAWLFICNPRKLKLRQVRELEPLRLEDEELGRVYQLVQDFRTMVTQRQVSILSRWLKEAQESGVAELKSFAAGIYRDYDAVRAALSTEWSQGQTEAQVHRLKLIKRQAYGRASFD